MNLQDANDFIDEVREVMAYNTKAKLLLIKKLFAPHEGALVECGTCGKSQRIAPDCEIPLCCEYRPMVVVARLVEHDYYGERRG